LTRPETVQGLAGHAVTAPPGVAVTLYDVIGDPPEDAGASHEMTADASPRVPPTAVGAPGTSAGVTAFDGADSGPLPTEFVACTVKVYDVPFVSPDTTQGDAAQVALAPPGLAETV
jgi:hypothetical protein